MNRAIKVFLGLVAAFVVLVVLGVLYVAVFFDANAYRDTIISRIEAQTGRSLALGDIHLSVFPTLGLKIDDAALGNLPGFGKKSFATVKQADVAVRLVPLLLHRELRINAIYVSGLTVDLRRNADGNTNWSDLVTTGKPAPAAHVKAEGFNLRTVEIGSISVTGAAVHYADARTRATYRLDDFSLNISSLQTQRPSTFRTQFKMASDAPEVTSEVKATGKLTFDLAAKRYGVQDLKLAVHAVGAAVPGKEQELKLSGDVDYDRAQDALRLASGRLDVAGVSAYASVDVENLTRDTLRYSGNLRVDSFNPRAVLGSLGMAGYRPTDIDALKVATLSAKVNGTRDSLALADLTLKLDDTTLGGALAFTSLKSPAVKFDLQLDKLNADRYVPISPRASLAAASRDPAVTGDVPIPMDVLDGFSAQGTLKAGQLTLHGIKMTDAAVKLAARAGSAKKIDLQAKLYGGSVVSSTRAVPGATARYTEKLALKGVDIEPLLKDATGKDFVAGRGNVEADLAASGASVDALLKTSSGKVALSLADGQVKGFDLGHLARQVQSLVDSGGNVDAVQTTTAQTTDFTALTASGKLAAGVLTSNDLKGASPLLRLAGAGSVDFVNSTIDYTLKPTFVNTATGQGGKTMADLRGVTIPVLITGPFDKIRYRPDLDALLKGKVKQEVARQLEKHKDEIRKGREHLKKEIDKSLQKGLKGLLGGSN